MLNIYADMNSLSLEISIFIIVRSFDVRNSTPQMRHISNFKAVEHLSPDMVYIIISHAISVACPIYVYDL